MRWTIAALFCALPVLVRAAEPPKTPVTIDIAYVGLAVARAQPASVLDKPPADEGLLGARLGLADDQTTGTFIGQHFAMSESVVAEADAAVAAAQRALEGVVAFA